MKETIGRSLQLRVKCDEVGPTVVCYLIGNLEQITVDHFRQALPELTDRKQVIFDLSAVPFIDSAGLGAIIGAIRRVRESGGEARCLRPQEVSLPSIANSWS